MGHVCNVPRNGHVANVPHEFCPLALSNDRIVMNVFKTVNGKEVKALELVSVRKK